MTRPLVFVDCETTGLDWTIHDCYEVAWARLDGDVTSVALPHTLLNADPASLTIGDYWGRGFTDACSNYKGKRELAQAFQGATLVGANPAFDAAFLRKKLGVATWHYRMIDVEQQAQWLLGFNEPRGLREIAHILRDLGHDIPEPDHTAAGDVATTRACYSALLEYRSPGLRPAAR